MEKLVNRMGVVTTYAYDTSHRLTSRTVASGTTDGAGNETASPDLALAETWTYLTCTKLPPQHRLGGLLTSYVYDHQLRREETTQKIPANQSLTSKYAYVDGKLYSTEDPHGRKTFYAYDDDGRTIRTVTGTVPESTVPGTVPDPYVNLLALNRDTTANADYIISDTVYSSAGDIERQHDGCNIETHFEYDSRARQTACIAAAGTTIESRSKADYDLDSHILAVRSPRYFDAFDADSVMIGILDPANNSLLTWNCTGNLTTQTITGYRTVLVSKSINALGKVRKSLTDAAGRTIENLDALGKVTTYTYDASGNRLSVRDPNNAGQDCTYDELGRDLTCTDTAGDATSSVYDRAGNKITATDAKNNTTTYAFDAYGRFDRVRSKPPIVPGWSNRV